MMTTSPCWRWLPMALLGLSLSSSAAPPPEKDLRRTTKKTAPTSSPLVLIPVGKTVGVLQLPSAEQRRADGGVWINIESSVDGLSGRRWLALSGAAQREGRLRERTRVNINDNISDAQAATGFLREVAGWKNVSLLESLAAARAHLRVVLEGYTLSDGTILIDTPPIEVSGTHKSKVKFSSSRDCREGVLRAYPWDTKHGRFGKSDTDIRFTVTKHRATAVGPSLCGIEKSANNAAGFIVVGDKDASGFTIRALVPANLGHLRDIKPKASGSADAYFRNENFRDILRPNSQVRTTNVTGTLPSLGEAGLVVHLFGNTGGKNGDEPFWQKTGLGHFSLGFFRVVDDPFSDTPVVEVTYSQIYGSNPEDIVSGRVSRESYLGDLSRGVSFHRAISDVLVTLPGRATRRGNIIRNDAIDTIYRELDIMAHRFRTGDGAGGSVIDSEASCVQSSVESLYVAIQSFRRNIIRAPETVRLRREDPRSEILKTIDFWHRYFARIEKKIVGWGRFRSDWRANAESGKVIRNDNKVSLRDAAPTALSIFTATPRSVHDRLATESADLGLSVAVQRLNFMVGATNVTPIAPKSILRRR